MSFSANPILSLRLRRESKTHQFSSLLASLGHIETQAVKESKILNAKHIAEWRLHEMKLRLLSVYPIPTCLLIEPVNIFLEIERHSRVPLRDEILSIKLHAVVGIV